MQIRPTILQTYASRDAFLQAYQPHGAGSLFVPGHVHLNTGDEVELEIVFANDQLVFHTRGMVRWKRMAAQRSLAAGIGVEFLSSEMKTRDLLLDFARGREVQLIKRLSRRFPVVLDVEVRHTGVLEDLKTDNISKDGAFIRTENLPEIGDTVELKFRPPTHKGGITIKGEVMWRQMNHRRGFGVRFNQGARAKQDIDELITVIREKLVQSFGGH